MPGWRLSAVTCATTPSVPTLGSGRPGSQQPAAITEAVEARVELMTAARGWDADWC